MNYKDISDRLTGKSVTLNYVGVYRDSTRQGEISKIIPRSHLELVDEKPGTLNAPFVGEVEGIHTIVNSNDEELYRNDALLEAYRDGPVEDGKILDQLRDLGVFSLDQ